MFKKQRHALWIGLGAAALALAIWHIGWLYELECSIWPYRVKWLAAKSPATDHIKIIALDDSSLRYMFEKDPELLRWPWPREVYAPILSFCKRGGAKAVIFDMIFDQPSRLGPGSDVTLAESIKTGPPFVIAVMLNDAVGEESWPGYCRQASLPTHQNQPLQHTRTFSHALPPVKPIAAAATLLGNVTENPDKDGIIRRVHLFSRFHGQMVPSLALAAFLAPGETAVRIENDVLHVGAPTLRAHVNGDGMILRYRGLKNTHRKISAQAVFESELRIQQGREDLPLEPAAFRDCYVFVGPTATALTDLKATPVDARYPGVEIQATALDNLLTGDFVRETPLWLTVVSTLLLCTLAASAGLAPRETWHSAAAFAVFVPLVIVLAFGMYVVGYWWPMVLQGVAVLGSLIAAVIVNYAVEGHQRRFIKQAFQHYLSPDVINRILDDPNKLSLGGERRALSIFFSDLQGFTSISEKLTPTDLTALLNDYLSDMTDIILDEGGTLDKYEGDAIIAFWNAPTDQPDHALRAVRAALRCQRKLDERREEFRERTGESLFMRIGVHSGEVVVGNMGSRRRFDYTVLGDAANLASRLEGANKALGTYTMISEATWRQTEGQVFGRELGELRVVGRQEPVRVFEPLALRGEKESELAAPFEQGLALCREGKWAEAKDVFQAMANDPAARTYAERCQALMGSGATEWDAVWNLTSK